MVKAILSIVLLYIIILFYSLAYLPIYATYVGPLLFTVEQTAEYQLS